MEKQRFKIGEVAELTGLQPYVLRYWETQFVGLRPKKNRSNHRVYTVADIELIQRIKSLVHDQGYTIEGARRNLEPGPAGQLPFDELWGVERSTDAPPPVKPASERQLAIAAPTGTEAKSPTASDGQTPSIVAGSLAVAEAHALALGAIIAELRTENSSLRDDIARLQRAVTRLDAQREHLVALLSHVHAGLAELNALVDDPNPAA